MLNAQTQPDPRAASQTLVRNPVVPPAPKTVDEYLAPLRPEQRAALESLRRIIRAAAPQAEECIAYRMPAFRLNGVMLVSFALAAQAWWRPTLAAARRGQRRLLRGHRVGLQRPVR